jgi:hypothetical protein
VLNQTDANPADIGAGRLSRWRGVGSSLIELICDLLTQLGDLIPARPGVKRQQLTPDQGMGGPTVAARRRSGAGEEHQHLALSQAQFKRIQCHHNDPFEGGGLTPLRAVSLLMELIAPLRSGPAAASEADSDVLRELPDK